MEMDNKMEISINEISDENPKDIKPCITNTVCLNIPHDCDKHGYCHEVSFEFGYHPALTEFFDFVKRLKGQDIKTIQKENPWMETTLPVLWKTLTSEQRRFTLPDEFQPYHRVKLENGDEGTDDFKNEITSDWQDQPIHNEEEFASKWESWSSNPENLSFQHSINLYNEYGSIVYDAEPETEFYIMDKNDPDIPKTLKIVSRELDFRTGLTEVMQRERDKMFFNQDSEQNHWITLQLHQGLINAVKVFDLGTRSLYPRAVTLALPASLPCNNTGNGTTDLMFLLDPSTYPEGIEGWNNPVVPQPETRDTNIIVHLPEGDRVKKAVPSDITLSEAIRTIAEIFRKNLGKSEEIRTIAEIFRKNLGKITLPSQSDDNSVNTKEEQPIDTSATKWTIDMLYVNVFEKEIEIVPFFQYQMSF